MAFQKKQRHVFPNGTRLIYCQGQKTTRFYFPGNQSWLADRFNSKVLPTAIAPSFQACKGYHSDRDLYAIAIRPLEP